MCSGSNTVHIPHTHSHHQQTERTDGPTGGRASSWTTCWTRVRRWRPPWSCSRGRAPTRSMASRRTPGGWRGWLVGRRIIYHLIATYARETHSLTRTPFPPPMPAHHSFSKGGQQRVQACDDLQFVVVTNTMPLEGGQKRCVRPACMRVWRCVCVTLCPVYLLFHLDGLPSVCVCVVVSCHVLNPSHPPTRPHKPGTSRSTPCTTRSTSFPSRRSSPRPSSTSTTRVRAHPHPALRAYFILAIPRLYLMSSFLCRCLFGRSSPSPNQLIHPCVTGKHYQQAPSRASSRPRRARSGRRSKTTHLPAATHEAVAAAAERRCWGEGR